MSKLATVVLVLVLLLNTALAGAALYVANLSKPTDYGDASGVLARGVGDIAQVAGYPVDAAAGDVAVPLKAMQRGGNFRVDFTAGKATSFGREEHEGTWDELAGAVVYRPGQAGEAGELVAIEVAFAVTSLRTDALPLTNTVLAGEKWFDYENHPTAVFVCDKVEVYEAPEGDDPRGAATHLLKGTFTLNGITKDIATPATLVFSGQSMTLDASFELLRSDYAVEKREGSLAGAAGGVVSEVDDAVAMRVRMTVSPDPSAVIAELAVSVEAQAAQLTQMASYLEQLEQRLRVVEAGGTAAGPTIPNDAAMPPIDASLLPKRFTDVMPVYSENIPEPTREASFEMIFVPGDEANGIAPFYMAECEATWLMLRSWSYGYDLTATEKAEQIGLGLRPTPVHGVPSILIQMNFEDNPARAMSRKTAESFCMWLSAKTGRHYRLPTEAEWEHAFRLGGGMPDDLSAVAWHFENAPYDEFFGEPSESPEEVVEVPVVGSLEPNSLGIHDMLGSVSEWVIPANPAERVLRGGNIQTLAANLTADWRDVEDYDAWHALYPQAKSLYWYPSYQFGGIRLVCEAQSVLDNPPTGEAPRLE